MFDDIESERCLDCGQMTLLAIGVDIGVLGRATLHDLERWSCPRCGYSEERRLPRRRMAISDSLRQSVRDVVPAFYVVSLVVIGGHVEIDARPPDGSSRFSLSVRRDDDDAIVRQVTEWIANEPWYHTRELWPDRPETWTTPPPLL